MNKTEKTFRTQMTQIFQDLLCSVNNRDYTDYAD
jgi:hypothetical protein